MTEQTEKQMKPIWYFVGLMLIVIGGIIFITGIYYWIVPARSGTVLYELHPDIWWGGFMLIMGLIFLFSTKKGTVES